MSSAAALVALLVLATGAQAQGAPHEEDPSQPFDATIYQTYEECREAYESWLEAREQLGIETNQETIRIDSSSETGIRIIDDAIANGWAIYEDPCAGLPYAANQGTLATVCNAIGGVGSIIADVMDNVQVGTRTLRASFDLNMYTANCGGTEDVAQCIQDAAGMLPVGLGGTTAFSTQHFLRAVGNCTDGFEVPGPAFCESPQALACVGGEFSQAGPGCATGETGFFCPMDRDYTTRVAFKLNAAGTGLYYRATYDDGSYIPQIAPGVYLASFPPHTHERGIQVVANGDLSGPDAHGVTVEILPDPYPATVSTNSGVGLAVDYLVDPTRATFTVATVQSGGGHDVIVLLPRVITDVSVDNAWMVLDAGRTREATLQEASALARLGL